MRRIAFIAVLLLSSAIATAQQVSVGINAGVTTLTGDCSLSGTTITCTKTNGSTLGTMATQNSTAISVTGGTISGVTANNMPLGGTQAAAGAFTSVSATSPAVDTSFAYLTPATGFSVTISAGVGRLIIDPAGTLATGTVVMPAAPVNGQVFVLNSSQIVTALTLSANAGQSILGAITTIGLGGRIECIYRSSSTTWYC